MNAIKKLSAHICNVCPICNYARKNPDSKIGTLVSSHSENCAAWKAQKEMFGSDQHTDKKVKESAE